MGTAPLVEDAPSSRGETTCNGDLQPVPEASYSGSADPRAVHRVHPARQPRHHGRGQLGRSRAGAGGTPGPVVVRFTCTEGSADLTEPCPEPVRIDRDGAIAEPLTRSITSVDGGRASVRVDGIRIDASGPQVRSSAPARG